MKKVLAIATALLPIILLLSCGREAITDEQAIENIVSTSDWFNVPSTQTSKDTPVTPGKYKDTLIDTVAFWWRAIPASGVTRDLNIQVIGDSAYVEATFHSTGKFNIIGKKDSVNWTGKSKLLQETSSMRAIFLRTGDKNAGNRGWELKKISGAVGYSDDTHSVRISSIRIQSVHSYPDTILTNPYETLFDTVNALKFSPAESIKITLTANTSDAEAFLHVFVGTIPIRAQMTNNGDGTYTIYCQANLIKGVRFVTFDLLKRETIHNTDYPYDFDGWLYPYMVR